jgi:putative tryptophan/tyrosine transport system substrate-binding protein
LLQRGLLTSLGRELVVFDIDTEQNIDSAFAAMAQRRATALVVSPDPSLNTQRDQIIGLAVHHAVPTMYPNREYALPGGLMNHGVELYDVQRQAGIYVGRILKGAKPTDLPILQPTKFELVINLKTAKALGLEIPNSVVVADDVIDSIQDRLSLQSCFRTKHRNRASSTGICSSTLHWVHSAVVLMR